MRLPTQLSSRVRSDSVECVIHYDMCRLLAMSLIWGFNAHRAQCTTTRWTCLELSSKPVPQQREQNAELSLAIVSMHTLSSGCTRVDDTRLAGQNLRQCYFTVYCERSLSIPGESLSVSHFSGRTSAVGHPHPHNTVHIKARELSVHRLVR